MLSPLSMQNLIPSLDRLLCHYCRHVCQLVPVYARNVYNVCPYGEGGRGREGGEGGGHKYLTSTRTKAQNKC